MIGSNFRSKAQRATGAPSARRSRLYWNGQEQMQEVSGGSGFAAQNDRRLHFGLGKDPQIEKAVIRWPSGKVQTLEDWSPGKLYNVRSRNESASAQLPTHPAASFEARGSDSSAQHNRYLPPLLITLHSAGRPALFRHPRELHAGRCWRSSPASSAELILSRIYCWQVAEPGQRLHHGHQRRHPDAFAGLLALRPVRADLDHVEVRDPRATARHLWNPSNFGVVAMLFLAPARWPSLSIQWGNFSLADDRDLGLGSVIIWRAAAFPYQRDLRGVVSCSSLCCAAGSPAIPGGRRFRRSPGRCISCSSSS